MASRNRDSFIMVTSYNGRWAQSLDCGLAAFKLAMALE